MNLLMINLPSDEFSINTFTDDKFIDDEFLKNTVYQSFFLTEIY